MLTHDVNFVGDCDQVVSRGIGGMMSQALNLEVADLSTTELEGKLVRRDDDQASLLMRSVLVDGCVGTFDLS